MALVFKQKKTKSSRPQQILSFPKSLKLIPYDKMVFPQDSNCYAFVFQEGVIIFWNFEDKMLNKMLQYFYFFIENRSKSYHEQYIYMEKYLHEQDNSFFPKRTIEDSMVFLNSTQIEEKLCISFSFLLSVNLKEIESKLNQIIEEIDEEHQFQLVSILKSFKQQSFLKELNQIYKLKSKTIFELQGVFDIFNQEMRDAYVPLFKQCRSALNIEQRKERILIRFHCFEEIFDHIILEVKKRSFQNFMKLMVLWAVLSLLMAFSKNFISLKNN